MQIDMKLDIEPLELPTHIASLPKEAANIPILRVPIESIPAQLLSDLLDEFRANFFAAAGKADPKV